jgi:hypothetical protein
MEIEKEKKTHIAKAYNKKMKSKLFHVGDMVRKTSLTLGMKSNKFGYWSHS